MQAGGGTPGGYTRTRNLGWYWTAEGQKAGKSAVAVCMLTCWLGREQLLALCRWMEQAEAKLGSRSLATPSLATVVASI